MVAGKTKTWTIILRRCAVVVAMIIAFFPVYWLVLTSLKPEQEWTASPPVWLTTQPTLQNYRIVFFPEAASRVAAEQTGTLDYKVSGNAWKAFADSTVISVFATFFSVLFGTLCAYSISRFKTGGDNFAFQFLTIRMFPPIAVVVPMVVLFSFLGLSDTFIGMITAYTAFTLPFSIWMIRSFIDDVPTELEGAAMIHGLRPLEAFVKVTLPLIKGGLLATALFVFILNWSEFLFALTLTSGKIVTVTVQVANYVSASSGKLYGVQAAMGTISTIPVVFFGYLIQRHLVRGLSFGSVKR